MRKLLMKILAIIDWEIIAIALIRVARILLESTLTDNENLSRKEKLMVQWVDVGNRTLGIEWAYETKTEIDDETVDQLEILANSIAQANNFKLHNLSPLS